MVTAKKQDKVKAEKQRMNCDMTILSNNNNKEDLHKNKLRRSDNNKDAKTRLCIHKLQLISDINN